MIGIGISYQMHGLVLVDKAGKVLRPSIIWCDSRAVQIGEKAFHGIGARPLPLAHAQLAGQLHRLEARMGEGERAGNLLQGPRR